MVYFAKSKNNAGNQATVKEHTSDVMDLAELYGSEFGMGITARLAGQFHDVGKYTQLFQDVLLGKADHIDHAIVGAWLLHEVTSRKAAYSPVVEAINGHHDGLLDIYKLRSKFAELRKANGTVEGNSGKQPAICGNKQLMKTYEAFHNDFPAFQKIPQVNLFSGTELESMLYTRMLFSCLVDADYSASAQNDDPSYLSRSDSTPLDPGAKLEKLYQFCDKIKRSSTSDKNLNRIRDEVFEQCGQMGNQPEGLFTLTAPTGTGKTLALLHFALKHSLAFNKKRIIIVLPFLTLAEQNAGVYAKIIPDVLVDHSQSDLPEEARELAARWTAPVIVTTSVRFFETLFADRPTMCRKLHNIANSVVVFDEAQSLPANLTEATLRAINELCRRYHTTMVFSSATQPDYSTLKKLQWQPREILPDHARLFDALKRVKVDWRINRNTSLAEIAEEMAAQSSVCAIVNLRRHARELAEVLAQKCPEDEVYYLTTDLCPAHRTKVVNTIKARQEKGLPCRVVATQCIEAGVDLDFRVLYRALAPLDAIIQAAGRCNRNGKLEHGCVIIFEPEDAKAYPDNWYRNAALIVKEMQPPFSIHDPTNIREYYRRLFADEKGNEALNKAIESRSFAETAKNYQLISNQGAQVIVPFPEEQERYDRVAAAIRNDGLTGALLKEAAPITVTCFARELPIFAEELPFSETKRQKNSKEPFSSNVYLLLPQNESLYSEQFGLRFPKETSDEFVF